MSDYRLLVLDLDGTALTWDKKLTERDVRAAAQLREAGVAITLNTGRLFTGSQWVAKTLGVRGSIAVVNGSERIDADSGEVVSGNYLDRPALRHLREVLSSRGLSTFVFGSRTIHYDRSDAAHAPYLGIWTQDLQAHDDVFACSAWEEHDDVVAVCAAGDTEPIDLTVDDLHAALPPAFRADRFHTYHGHRFFKLRHAVEDKGTALHALAAERGFTAAQTVAVGDWMNDLPMLREAGLSFAMGHAEDSVKQAADEVLHVDRSTGGAIAEVAERVWGLRVAP